ncbi:restriction endonuclease subunit S [Sphingomonas sp. R-74633]|uniref:restriction endonuclease subunit S n=1 Tax=Sphingomonas sp. R-74633 TaxID=2751188 RepID=UPI0015D1CBF0|nr:restriction endonuclease subunit S [Sphingomonas sp. R-74633]NYT40787.1 restriction endonuclease subunit S [Sphingomonas sp. R-74633]
MSDPVATTVQGLIDAGIIHRPIDGNHGSIHPKSTDYVPTGIPFVMATDLVDGRVDFETCYHITEKQAKSLRKGFAQVGDVLLSHKATIGRTAIIQENPFPFVMLTPQVTYYRVKDRSKLSPEYLKYVFDSHEFQKTMKSWAGDGSTRAYIGITAQHKLPIYLHDKAQQDSIVEIIDPLVRKIELNRRMNETLEGMAQAIFRDWFVDFGPTRRKAAGEADPVAIMGGLIPDPARAADLAALFPAAFGDDGLPGGWTQAEFGAEFDLTMGQSPPGDTYNDTGDGLPFFQGRTDFGFRYPENRKFCSAPSRIANAGDTLISVRAPVGDLNMAWERCCIGRGVACARHKSGSTSYTFYTLRSLQPELELYEHTGTVFGAINRKQFERLPIVKSSNAVVEAFEAIAGPMDQKLKLSTQESRTLAETRDYLLPRLMSGMVRVAPKAEVA